MPTYPIQAMEGRTLERKKRVAGITRFFARILGDSPESVDILIAGARRKNRAAGGPLFWAECP